MNSILTTILLIAGIALLAWVFTRGRHGSKHGKRGCCWE